jgi:exodeoxyribonuclease V alpha subunit
VQTEAQLRAEIDRISFRNEENGWTVLRARNCDDNSTVTVTGHFADIKPGELYQLIGTWSNHPTYGKQLKVDRSVPLRPNTRAAMERYLGSGLISGIGPKTAAKIVAHFGEDTFSILDENPGCLLQVKSINKKKAKVIIEAWSAQKAVADVMMFLSTHGISPTFATRIFKAYGAESIDVVSTDPYRLAQDIDGIGFLNADKIARSVGIALNSPQRIKAGILYVLGQAEERGHCWVTTPQLKQMLIELLGVTEADVDGLAAPAVEQLNLSGRIVSEKRTDLPTSGDDSGSEYVHYSTDLLVSECNVALILGRMLQVPLEVDTPRIDLWIERYAEVSGTSFSEAQMEAVKRAATSRVFVLTGGPGVGKTTTANAIIRLFKAMGKTVALAAPTGRAAQRLSEVAAEKARTIHRLLEWQPGLGGFTRDENNPLACDVVIVDEASMLDIRLADALIRAVPQRAQLILIGDVDQLPSVGPGNVLRDLIDSKLVPFTRLTEIFRQAATSGIVRAAHAINNGGSPEFNNTPTSDCRF